MQRILHTVGVMPILRTLTGSSREQTGRREFSELITKEIT